MLGLMSQLARVGAGGSVGGNRVMGHSLRSADKARVTHGFIGILFQQALDFFREAFHAKALVSLR